MATEYSESELNKMIISYKKMRAREQRKYLKKKESPEFIVQNRARAKSHYEAHKEIKAKNYQENKELYKFKSLYNYYKINDKLNKFIEKYPERVQYLNDHGFKVELQVQVQEMAH